jgi:hypothetical protein
VWVELPISYQVEMGRASVADASPNVMGASFDMVCGRVTVWVNPM